jgi:PGF-CTERM protein
MTTADPTRTTVGGPRRRAVVLVVTVVVVATVAVLATAPAGSAGGTTVASGEAPAQEVGNGGATEADWGTATRTIEDQELPPGGTTTVILEVTIQEPAGKISISDGLFQSLSGNPAFEEVGNLSVEFRGGSGTKAFVETSKRNGVNVGVEDVPVGTTIVITYDVTVTEEPDELGGFYNITSSILSNEHRDEVGVSGDSRIDVITTTTTTTATTTTSGTTTGTTTTTSDSASFQDWWFSPLEPAVGETVTFVAIGSEDATYRWDFDGDGVYDESGKIVTHGFGSTGEHTVELRVEDVPDGPITREQQVQVDGEVASTQSGDGPSFWFSPTRPLPVELVTFVADTAVATDSVAALRWDLDGDGTTDEEGDVVTHGFPGPGNYTVELQVERTDGETLTVERTVAVEGETANAATTTTSSDDGISTDVDVPGFGVPVAVLAVMVALLLAHRRADE